MVDILTKKQRSYCMSRIRGRNTKTELMLRKYLKGKGLQLRIGSNLLGQPDIILPKKKTAVFVDGCFWHKCFKCFVKPATRTKFWMKKISGNVRRDKIVNRKLERSGWKVIRVWEHQIKENIVLTGDRIIRKIQRT